MTAVEAVTQSEISSRADAERLGQVSRELEALRAENERLRTLLALAQQSQAVITSTRPTVATVAPKTGALVHSGSPAAAKLALIRALFRGRDDLYALRFENARSRKSGYVPAVAGGWTRAGPKRYLPLNDEAIERHLRGTQAIGIYPLLADDRCWFLAVDLDGPSWQLDALALIDVAAARGIQVALERSRSGEGAHLWVFFAEAVTAAAARRLGAPLLREAMMLRAELDLGSYDRLFPSQDTLPEKGFGNLIALPLQGRCRAEGPASSSTRRRWSRGPTSGRSSAGSNTSHRHSSIVWSTATRMCRLAWPR